MKDWLNCKICNKDFINWDELTGHVKLHKISQKKYFETYHPKVCMYNAGTIGFKSLEQYVLSDFSDKRAMKSWLKKVGTDKATSYLARKLQTYCKMKKMEWVPSESILKSINVLPSISVFEDLTKVKFHTFCESLGLKCHFNYSLKVTPEKISQIVTDTRERTPIKFSDTLRKVSMKLDEGDYALSPNSKIVIERKSLSDFYGTLGVANYERFLREINRVKEGNKYIVILVESSYNNLVYGKWRWGRANPEFIFHRVREIYKTYNCVQFIFADNRSEMKSLIPKILGLKDAVRKLDLQYLYDNELI